MNRSFSKIRHIQMVNENLEKKRQQNLLREQGDKYPFITSLVNCLLLAGFPKVKLPKSCSTNPSSSCPQDIAIIIVENLEWTVDYLTCFMTYNTNKTPELPKIELPKDTKTSPTPQVPTDQGGTGLDDMINQGVKVGTDILNKIPYNPF